MSDDLLPKCDRVWADEPGIAVHARQENGAVYLEIVEVDSSGETKTIVAVTIGQWRWERLIAFGRKATS